VRVGGDWYDAIRLLDGRVLLTIGDVTGSGLKAAVVMGVVRQIMRGIAQLHAEPALMLDAADRALRLEYPETLVTAWVGILDLVGHTLTYASAGHPAPLLIDMQGGVHDLNHLTLPIGLRQGHQGHASTIPISDGSAIWLYTDGLIEASHNIIDDDRRLHETAVRLGADITAGPAATIRNLMIPNGSPDDVAILVVKIDFDESDDTSRARALIQPMRLLQAMLVVRLRKHSRRSVSRTSTSRMQKSCLANFVETSHATQKVPWMWSWTPAASRRSFMYSTAASAFSISAAFRRTYTPKGADCSSSLR
jgi:hypothetical protein